MSMKNRLGLRDETMLSVINYAGLSDPDADAVLECMIVGRLVMAGMWDST